MIYVVLSLVGIGLTFAMIRLIIGPTPLNRVVSLDTVNIIITALIVLFALIFESELYLDIAIVYGVLAFLETVIIGKYMEAKAWK